MRFEDELEKRLTSVRQREQDREELAKQSKVKEQLLLKTKDVIDSVLFVTAEKFKNASTEPTHAVDPITGEVTYKVGTGHMCIIDFKQDETYGFSTPCRLAFNVDVTAATEIAVTSVYDQRPDALWNFAVILEMFKTVPAIVFTGQYDSVGIKSSVEGRVLEVLDAVRVN